MYSGNWINNQIEGIGKFKSPDGRYYKGTWKDNKLHGTGKYNGQTDQNIQVNILMINRMAQEHSIGKMEKSMKDNGKKANSMAKAS